MRQSEGKSERGLHVFKDMRGEGARGDGLHRLSDKSGALTSVCLYGCGRSAILLYQRNPNFLICGKT